MKSPIRVDPEKIVCAHDVKSPSRMADMARVMISGLTLEHANADPVGGSCEDPDEQAGDDGDDGAFGGLVGSDVGGTRGDHRRREIDATGEHEYRLAGGQDPDRERQTAPSCASP